jgi:hypothetical protein
LILCTDLKRIRSSHPDIPPPPPLTFVEHVVAFILALSFALNILYKWLTGWRFLGYLLFPCHILSFLCI